MLVGLFIATASSWLPERSPPVPEPASAVEPDGVFSSARLHVAFEEGVSEADARALADDLGHTVEASEFAAPRVVAYETDAATADRLQQLRARADVEAAVVHDWRAEARAAAEGAPPADGLCVMRTNQANQVEVVFRSGTPEAVARAAVERAGLELREWEPSPQTLVLRVASADEAAPRLEQAPGVRWTALTTATLALAE